MKSFRHISICLFFLACTLAGSAQQEYQLYVNGVLYKAPSILEKGLPYFPVDVLSEATGVAVVSFSDTSVRLAGSPVDFVPAVRQGRPYLPAEAFAMASGSGVERDQTRGLVLYSAAPKTATASAMPAGSGPARANPGMSAGDPGPAPEPPVAGPPAAAPEGEGMHEAVVEALRSAEEITYAQRWLKHKMYWADQLDPANSPYLRVDVPPAATFPMYTPHPWSTP